MVLGHLILYNPSLAGFDMADEETFAVAIATVEKAFADQRLNPDLHYRCHPSAGALRISWP